MRGPKIGASEPDLLSSPFFIEVSPECELSRDDGQQRRDELYSADYASNDVDASCFQTKHKQHGDHGRRKHSRPIIRHALPQYIMGSNPRILSIG